MHQPVLLQESIDALDINPDGIYIDCTFGRGGHSSKILSQLSSQGRLICIDKDQEAIDKAKELFADDTRVIIQQGSYSKLDEIRVKLGLNKVDGFLFDLGVSSPQLDDASRGFSFMNDGPLDMRMDLNNEINAATWLNNAPEDEIVKTLFEYGEEKFARKIAAAIVKARTIRKIERTSELASLIKNTLPFYEKNKHPATRTFQAIRIKINNELQDLKGGINSAINMLSIGGKICVISFHSLEDRLVKQTFNGYAKVDIPSTIPILDEELNKLKTLKVLKKVKPSMAEVQANPRARSAILRIAIKL